MTDIEQDIRARYLVMEAVEAFKAEGSKDIHIGSLWAGTLCPYVGWDRYLKAVKTLWEAKAFTVDGEKIVIRRGK